MTVPRGQVLERKWRHEQRSAGDAHESLSDAERRWLLARRQFDHELGEAKRATRAALTGLGAAVGLGVLFVAAALGIRALTRARRRQRGWVVCVSVEPAPVTAGVLPALAEAAARAAMAQLARSASASAQRVRGGDGGPSSGALGSISPADGAPAGEGSSSAPVSFEQP